MAKMTKMGGDPKPEAPKKEKRPLVNWFSREKEVEFSNKKVGNKDMNVKTKVVKAPESVISKGFEKKVVKTSTPLTPQQREKNNKKGGKIMAVGFGLATIGNMANAVVRNEIEKKIGRDYSDAYKNNNKPQQEEAYKKYQKNDDRSYKITKGLAAAAPLSLMAGIPIASKKNEGKSTRVATKTVTPRKKRG